MSIFRWTSKSEFFTPDGTRYDIVKYDDRIRKQAGLHRTIAGRSVVVAWFPDESDAILFAETVLGGVHRYAAEG